jgi:AbrB family looped-hinge helix DNA binding protein
MSKVTSKLQVTVPKELADRYGIRPGSEIDWVPAGDTLRVIPAAAAAPAVDLAERSRLFDAATARQKKRQARVAVGHPKDRGWKREELYRRGVPR